LNLIDWVVVAVYALTMLAIGWYYSRRVKTADDYLLGGRSMPSVTVGVSLFATLLSTLSYLALPGEMIQHGPMVLSQIAAIPFIALVVGRFLIPFIMGLRVTSAYEILESRLGLSVRILGSSLFLSLRLLWMASILYATARTVLVQVLEIDPSATIYLCAAMALITIVYTSSGGLRAVVATDALQSLIMLIGAVTTIVVISVELGGVSEWWPTESASHWVEFQFGFDRESRMTFLGMVTAGFTWYVCTAGSDQMAIQRYLSTRDVKAARRVLTTALISDTASTILLALVGLAVLGYFSVHRDLMTEGVTFVDGADKLFPRFIIIGLPVGVTGLVVAALLSAAMSSLSSGMNSSSAVITVDFLERLGGARDTHAGRVRRARYVSVVIGVVVVLLSGLIGTFKGNLFDLCYKVVNLFTAPLFLLFFMAMFIRWATPIGTLIAAAASIAVAVSISFYKIFDLAMLWIMPGSLVTGIVVGMVASAVTPGKKQ